MPTLKELQEKREKLANEIQTFASATTDWTAEKKGEWDVINKAYNENLTELENEVKKDEAAAKERQEVENRLKDIASYKPYSPANFNRPGQDGGSLNDGPINKGFYNAMSDEHRQTHALALQAWMRAGTHGKYPLEEKHLRAAQKLGVNLNSNEFTIELAPTETFKNFRRQHEAQNVMKAGDPLTGGSLIGSTMVNNVERAMLDFAGPLQFADIIRTSNGEPYIWPTIDDTANQGTLVGESQDAGTATDLNFGQNIWHAFDYTSGMAKISRTLLQDSPIDLEALLGEMLGERMARKLSVHLTTGTGAGLEPKGIVTSAALGVTGASTTAIVFDELIDLEHSIDPSRRSNKGVAYSFHDSILQHIRKLKSGDGLYMWSNGTQAGQPDLVNGRRYYINQNMASSIASGAKTILFGQLNMFKVRMVNQFVIQRLVERFAEYNQDAFVGYMRADGGLLNAGDNPVKYLTH